MNIIILGKYSYKILKNQVKLLNMVDFKVF